MPRRSIQIAEPTGPESPLKYRLNEMMSRYLPRSRRPIKLQLCKELGISEVTWSKWANIRKEDTHDLPYHSVVHIALRLGVKPEQLSTVKVEAEPIQPDLFGKQLELSAAQS